MVKYISTFERIFPMSYLDFAAEYPEYMKCLRDEDIEKYKEMNMEDQIRWILNVKRIDWNKFFENCTSVHTLAKYAAGDPSVRPLAFLRPDYVDVNLHQYNENCPDMDIMYDEYFYEAAKRDDMKAMKEYYDVLEMRRYNGSLVEV